MSAIVLGLAIALAGGSPMKDGFAYSRETLGGIPGSGSLETRYFVYVVLPKGTAAPTGASVWLKGRLHAATVEKVRTPVQVPHDPVVATARKDTLVPATTAAVYQVVPGDAIEAAPSDDAERQAAKDNDVLVCLSTGASVRRVAIKSLQVLPPAQGQ
jgi:hypothetical protein